MAVFTAVSREQLDAWLAHHDIGRVSAFEGISSGIENSNFFVTTARGAWVLTLFERLSAEQLPFYLELMRHLAARGVPCPAPVADRNGRLFSLLNGKPAALVTRLPGKSVMQPEAAHCRLVGTALARMHLAGHNFPLRQPNLRGLAWWQEVVPGLYPFLTAETAALLADELAVQTAQLPAFAARAPSGPVHADLFRDNALFDGERLGGFIRGLPQRLVHRSRDRGIPAGARHGHAGSLCRSAALQAHRTRRLAAGAARRRAALLGLAPF